MASIKNLNIISKVLMIIQFFIIICDSNEIDNNQNIHQNMTLISDYSSVENFRNNVEHKVIYIDDDDDVDNNDLINNDNQRLYYDTFNVDQITVNTKFNNNSIINDTTIRQQRKKRDTKIMICDYGCECKKDINSITVICDLTINKMRDPIFGRKLEVPKTTRSFIIKLDQHSNIRIEDGLFEKNSINRFDIEGPYESLTQVEISTDAFKGNNGPYPEINFINCGKIVLRSKSFSGDFTLNITNVDEVHIFENAFSNTQFFGYFENIKDLRISEKGFNKAMATLNIKSSTIEELNRFEASLREVRFTNCNITTINTGTFDVININAIVFEGCKIDTVKTKAITEKLLSNQFQITDATIRLIESEAIAGSGITELILSQNEIDTIQDNAIYVSAANATITHNKIKHLGNEWLRVDNWSNITISNNQFGDFGQVILKQTQSPVICKFEGNFITNPLPGSLNITNRNCIIRDTSFYQLCSCNMTWLEKLSSRDLRSESYCQIDNTLKFCFNTTIFNVLKYINEVCDYTKPELDCLKSLKNNKKINGEFLSPEELEKNTNKLQLIYILSGIGILLVLVIIIFIVATKCIARKATTMPINDNITAPSTSTLNCGTGGAGTAHKGGEHKLFSNEDRRLINITLTTLEEKYPPAVFDEVERNTKILLGGNITEMQRVQAIGNIVQILSECPNSGTDFIVFTEILYKHLRSSGGTAPPIPIEPTYSEPALPDRNFIVADGNGGHLTQDGQTNIDHIYAEPTSVQQPLLTNEYASPADRSESELYSEPFTNERDHKIIPPYAILNPRNHNIQSPGTTKILPLPSTSKANLPDVLNPSSTISSNIKNNNNNNHYRPPPQMTNVQKIANNFANDPNFHITRSPNSNRRIPQYTIPANKTKLSSPSQPQPSKLASNSVAPLSSFDPIDHFYSGASAISYTPGFSGNNNNNSNTAAGGGDNESDHSGGSDVTVQMDDIIEYADADGI